MRSFKHLYITAAFTALFVGCVLSADSFGDMGHCIDATCGAKSSYSLPTVIPSLSFLFILISFFFTVFVLINRLVFPIPDCTKDDIGYSFSSCEEALGTRKVTYFWRPPALCNPTPEVTLPPVTTIPCGLSSLSSILLHSSFCSLFFVANE